MVRLAFVVTRGGERDNSSRLKMRQISGFPDLEKVGWALRVAPEPLGMERVKDGRNRDDGVYWLVVGKAKWKSCERGKRLSDEISRSGYGGLWVRWSPCSL
jgi:hypothetical protein